MEVVTINVLYVMAHSHSVADDQPFHDDETFSDPFVMPGSPGSASVSSSSEDENVDKQAAALLTVYSGSGSSSAITGKKHNVSQTCGRSIQLGEINCSVKRSQRQHGGSTGSRIQQGIWNAGTGSDNMMSMILSGMTIIEFIQNFQILGPPGLSIEPYDGTFCLSIFKLFSTDELSENIVDSTYKYVELMKQLPAIKTKMMIIHDLLIVFRMM